MDKEEDIGDDEEETDSATTEESEETGGETALEKESKNILSELEQNEDLHKYAIAFSNLIEALAKARVTEKSLIGRCESLQAELETNTSKTADALAMVAADKETIESLKQETEKACQLADAAHAREQNAQQIIENLRQQVTHLKKELDQKSRMSDNQADGFGPSAKNKEGLMKERERLMNEIVNLRERLSNAQAYQEDLERKNSAADLRINELTQEIEAQASEASKEQRIRDRLEQEVKELSAQLGMKNTENTILSSQLKQALGKVEKMENNLLDEKQKVENLTKETDNLNDELQRLQLHSENQQEMLDRATEEISKKSSELKLMNDEVAKMNKELARANKAQAAYVRKAQQIDQLRGEVEKERDTAYESLSLLQRELLQVQRQGALDKRTIENLTREKDIAKSSLVKASMKIANQSGLLTLAEQAKRDLTLKAEESASEAARQKKFVSALEHERDRHVAEGIELTQKVQETMEDLKLKQMAIFDLKKQLAEAETKFRMQLNLYEALRSDRNAISKNLQEAQDGIYELKHKLKVMTHQIEQLKEDISVKENQLLKKESALQKLEKERESLRVDLQQSRDEVSECRFEIAGLNKEVRRLQIVIEEADTERRRQLKAMEEVLSERDILGTQLVRRNEELSLLHEKIRILEVTQAKGEEQYEQRVEDIRLLKLEIQRLRQEKYLLTRNSGTMNDLRQKILHLERDLTHEKLKCRALEDDLQNPLNVHRWRKLKGSDPEKHELIQKIQFLQKRVISMSKVASIRKTQLQDTERLYIELSHVVEKKPGPDVQNKLMELRHILQKKDRTIMCLETEMTMFKSEISEYKFKIEQVQLELNDFKKKYYEVKRREQKRKEHLADENRALGMLPPIAQNQNNSKSRFTGGGFNLNAQTTPRTTHTS